MKIWKAFYHWSGGYGAYQCYYAVVVAETEQVALGLVLEEYSDTPAKGWSLSEIDSSIAAVHYITDKCN